MSPGPSVDDEQEQGQQELSRPDRLAAVARVVAAGPTDARLDRLVSFAAELLGSPHAQVSLVGDTEQVVASTFGLLGPAGASQEPASGSLCAVAVRSGRTLVVDDAAQDARVNRLPPVTGGLVGSYLGTLLADVDGNVLGSLCVYGPEARTWTPADVKRLTDVAALVDAELDDHIRGLSGLDLRVSLAADAADLGTFTHELSDGGRVDWDRRMCELHTVAPETFAGTWTAFAGLVHPDDLEGVRRAFRRAEDSVGELVVQYRVLVPGRSDRWIRLRGRAVTDMLGRPSHLVGAAYDASTERDLRDDLYRLMETMPAALVRVDREWTITYVNVHAEGILGHSREELLGRNLHDVVPDLADSVFGRAYQRAMSTGTPETVEDYFAPLDTWFEVRIWPDQHGLTLFNHDVTVRAQAQLELTKARDRLAVLAAAGTRLSGSLQPQEVLDRLAGLILPKFGCAITIAVTSGVAELLGIRIGKDTDRLHVVHVSHVDHRRQLELRRLLDELDLRSGADSGLGLVVRTGRPQSHPRVPDELLAARAQDEQQLERMRELNDGAQITLPLASTTGVLGAVTIAGAPDQALDEPLLEDLAARAAVALENALTYVREHRAATVLQRALLPQLTPITPGVLVASRYLPAAEQALAGGDFFRLVDLGRSLVCAIGDVMGHGTASAARAGQLHGLVATLALQGMQPGALLTRLSEVVDQLMDLELATLLVCDYDPASRELTVATAGHPPPLIVPLEGDPFYADLVAGPPIGVATAQHEQTTLVLPAGCTVVLFSDGLVERRGESLTDGLERLRQAVRDVRLPPEAVADHVLQVTGVAAGADDDVALVVLNHP